MPLEVPFRLKLTGDTSDRHQFQGYDGYMALAGFARMLSMAANYAETGKIRQKGDFFGRQAVMASPLEEGSIIADFIVYLEHSPEIVFGTALAAVTGRQFLWSLVNRVINRNIGEGNSATDAIINPLLLQKGGDVEALVAISEAPIRQAHSVIGRGANKVQILGGHNVLNNFTTETREYVKANVEDDTLMTKYFSVSAFNANSGYGSVFDSDLGHVIPFSMSSDTLKNYKPIFSWGLDQYANNTGNKIKASFTRILALDGREKRYIMKSASFT